MITVTDLVAKYGDQVVLKGVSLHVRPHETMVLMGQSGCGKTTLLKHIVGLLKPASGTIIVDGHDMTTLSPRDYRELAKHFGMLFQSGALFNSMTVEDNIAFPLREHYKLAPSVVRLMVRMKLELVGLGGTGQKMPAELSGGMRKRAGLARALILDPRIVFLDEPTSGLDPIIAAGIDELVVHIKEAFNTTMVVVSHDVESCFRTADRIAVFHNGTIIQVGTPDEIRNSPHDYVQQIVQRRPPPEAEGRSEFAESILNST